MSPEIPIYIQLMVNRVPRLSLLPENASLAKIIIIKNIILKLLSFVNTLNFLR